MLTSKNVSAILLSEIELDPIATKQCSSTGDVEA